LALSRQLTRFDLAVPCNILLKKFKRPSTYIGILVVSWGIVMTFTGVVKDFAGLVTCRIFLGIAEAGFFPGVWLSEVLHRLKKRTNHPCSMLSLLTHVPYRIWLSLTLPAPYFF
jgi:hypothetical protein